MQDMRPDGMLHARAVRQPSPGAELRRADITAVERMPGVVKVIRDGDYLAVVAIKEWQAIKAMRALAASAEWQEERDAAGSGGGCGDDPFVAGTGYSGFDMDGRGDAAGAADRRKLYTPISDAWRDRSVLRAGGVRRRWTDGLDPLAGRLSRCATRSHSCSDCRRSRCGACMSRAPAVTAITARTTSPRMPALIAHAIPGKPIRVQWMREQEHTSEPYGSAMVAEVSGAIDADGHDRRLGLWRLEQRP